MVDHYLKRLRELRNAERRRLRGFQAAEFGELNMTRAYSGLPLYRVLQMGGDGGDGPYGFARDVSKMYDPGKKGKDEWSEAQLKTFASTNHLTADDMSTIIVQTGHSVRNIQTGFPQTLHGQETDTFGSKYTMNQFAAFQL